MPWEGPTAPQLPRESPEDGAEEGATGRVLGLPGGPSASRGAGGFPEASWAPSPARPRT